MTEQVGATSIDATQSAATANTVQLLAFSEEGAPAHAVPLPARSGPAGATSLLPRQHAGPVQPTRFSIRLRALLLAGLGAVAAGAAGHLGWQYWTVGQFRVTTDDAYVKADTITIAPKVSGYIETVLVGDNDRVEAGQVLARIDDRDFKVARQQAEADVVGARATIATRRAALDAQHSAIEAARATIAADEADAMFAGQEDQRYRDLAATGSGSIQNAQKAASRYANARAAISRDTAALASAVKQLDVLKAELGQAQAALARSEALRTQAELNLSYTTIVAPTKAVVGNRTLRVGQYVQAGTQLMALVPADGAYVLANYKETQLTHVHSGQPVALRIDMFPGRSFTGHVDSLSPASGQEFALLPPDNATGNFTKVVQRIPVKIVLDPIRASSELRPGMSVVTTIDTRTPRPNTGALLNNG